MTSKVKKISLLLALSLSLAACNQVADKVEEPQANQEAGQEKDKDAEIQEREKIESTTEKHLGFIENIEEDGDLRLLVEDHDTMDKLYLTPYKVFDLEAMEFVHHAKLVPGQDINYILRDTTQVDYPEGQGASPGQVMAELILTNPQVAIAITGKVEEGLKITHAYETRLKDIDPDQIIGLNEEKLNLDPEGLVGKNVLAVGHDATESIPEDLYVTKIIVLDGLSEKGE